VSLSQEEAGPTWHQRSNRSDVPDTTEHRLGALDFQFDHTSDSRMLKLLNLIDEYSRECPAIDVERSIDADGVVRCLGRIAAERGAPRNLRFDNGPEFIAVAVADLCFINTRSSSTRFALAECMGRIGSTVG
jgi:hypothetical protein